MSRDFLPRDLAAVATSALANEAVITALLNILLQKNLLNETDIREVYVEAIEMIEKAQEKTSRDETPYQIARQFLEERLREIR